jgi:hypothetical protein
VAIGAEKQIRVRQPRVRQREAAVPLDRPLEAFDRLEERVLRPLVPEEASLEVQLVGVDHVGARLDDRPASGAGGVQRHL